MYRLRLKAFVVACAVAAAAVIGPRETPCQPLAFIGSWPSGGLPLGLALDGSGLLYVADEHNAVGLRVFSQGGVPLGMFNPGGLIESYGIGILSDQSIIFADYYGCRVLRYSAGGAFLSQFATGGTRAAFLAVDESDNVYVTDDQEDKVRKFTSSGALLTQWVVTHPSGVAYANGQVFVSEQFNGRISVFSPTGTPQGSFAHGATFPQQLTANGTGELYLGDHGTHQLRCFSTDGTLLWTLGPTVPGYPFASPDLFSVIQAPDGTLFVGDYNNLNVLIFAPTPVATVRNSFGALKARYRGE